MPKIINSDNGSEFTSNEFKKLMKDNQIAIRYVEVGDHHKLGIIDRFIRTLRSLISNYQTAYKTTRYIDVLDKLVKNYNNSYHSGIKGIPSKPEKDHLISLNDEKYKKAAAEEIQFKKGQNVRFIKNKKMFEKGLSATWSKTIHKIIDRTEHTYILDNNKVFKYYELMPADDIQQLHIAITRAKEKEPTKEQLRKANTIKRRLTKEGIDITNIVREKRDRKPTDRFKF